MPLGCVSTKHIPETLLYLQAEPFDMLNISIQILVFCNERYILSYKSKYNYAWAVDFTDWHTYPGHHAPLTEFELYVLRY